MLMSPSLQNMRANIWKIEIYLNLNFSPCCFKTPDLLIYVVSELQAFFVCSFPFAVTSAIILAIAGLFLQMQSYMEIRKRRKRKAPAGE